MENNKSIENKIYDVIIIGAGTAGMSAGIYLRRGGKSVLIIEEKTYGGQIILSKEVENYPGIKHISGYEFAMGLYNQTFSLGAEFVFEKVIGITENDFCEVITDKSVYCSKNIIIATGAKNRPLGLEQEERYIGKGISYCATCDGAFYKGRNTAIVGGGNTALEDALFLSNYCKNVTIIHRRDTFRGEEALLNQLRNKKNVDFIMNSQVINLQGKDNLTSVIIRNKEGKNSELVIDGLFIAIGQMPQNNIFSSLVKIDEKGYIIADESCKTNRNNIFAIGDCRKKKVRQLVTAASDGAIAALEIQSK